MLDHGLHSSTRAQIGGSHAARERSVHAVLWRPAGRHVVQADHDLLRQPERTKLSFSPTGIASC